MVSWFEFPLSTQVGHEPARKLISGTDVQRRPAPKTTHPSQSLFGQVIVPETCRSGKPVPNKLKGESGTYLSFLMAAAGGSFQRKRTSDHSFNSTIQEQIDSGEGRPSPTSIVVAARTASCAEPPGTSFAEFMTSLTKPTARAGRTSL